MPRLSKQAETAEALCAKDFTMPKAKREVVLTSVTALERAARTDDFGKAL